MTYPPYLREKARQMRREMDLTIDEIAERLAIGRTTIYAWVHDMPRPKRAVSRQSPNQRRGNTAMQLKYRQMREQAYELGRWEFPRMCPEPTFRDFVCLFIAEGYKRNRNVVSIANSDPAVIAIADHWMRSLSRNKITYWLQYHADQNLGALQTFWSDRLGVASVEIRTQRKSNSNQLAARTWRSKHGVLTVTAHDTCFRARLQGWVDCTRDCWLDSAAVGA